MIAESLLFSDPWSCPAGSRRSVWGCFSVQILFLSETPSWSLREHITDGHHKMHPELNQTILSYVNNQLHQPQITIVTYRPWMVQGRYSLFLLYHLDLHNNYVEDPRLLKVTPLSLFKMTATPCILSVQLGLWKQCWWIVDTLYIFCTVWVMKTVLVNCGQTVHCLCCMSVLFYIYSCLWIDHWLEGAFAFCRHTDRSVGLEILIE